MKRHIWVFIGVAAVAYWYFKDRTLFGLLPVGEDTRTSISMNELIAVRPVA